MSVSYPWSPRCKKCKHCGALYAYNKNAYINEHHESGACKEGI